MGVGEIQPDPELCESCRHLHLTRLLKSSDSVLLGSLESIFLRSECALCRLITGIFLHPWIAGGYSKEITESEVKHATMGMCYMTGNKDCNSDFLSLAVPTARSPGGAGPPDILKGHIYLTSRGCFDPSLEQSRIARVLKSEVNFEVIRQWLTGCDESHPSCLQTQDQSWQRMPSGFRLIDVQRRCLVKPLQRPRYFALSYVWGSSSSLKTTRSTIKQFSVSQALSKSRIQLPEIVESAMEFVESLSERYLWVDALCIIQDDEADLSDQISKMDAVYLTSYATLIAAGGASSQSRLPGLSNSPRVVKQTVEAIQGNTYVAGSYRLFSRLNETVWNTRGWTYQERELSSRQIYVFDDECFWECRNDIRCESSMLSAEPEERLSSIRRGISSLGTSSKNLVPRNKDFLYEFFGSVRDYTSRKLTNPNDISNAFAGLCTAIQNFGHVQMVSGMPVEFLPEAMLWQIAGVSTRRLSTFSHQGITWIFPSWSWFGWMGVILHHTSRINIARLEIDNTHIQIQKEMVDPKRIPGITNLSDCWGEVMKLKGRLATFRISHQEALIEKGPYSNDGNQIGWRMFDKASNYCGIARLTAITFKDAADDYVCLLISRSRVSEAGMHDGASRRLPKAVTIQSKEEIPRYLTLPLDSTDWPNQEQAYTYIAFEETDWAYLNVLVLRYLGDGQIYERVGTGQIHEDAWTGSSPEYCDISII